MATGGLRRYVDEIAENSVAQGMMRDLMQPLILMGRHPDEMEDERSLGLGAHHAVNRRQFAHAIGRHQHRGAANTGVAVGGVRRVQLVRAPNPFDFRATINGVAQRKRIVPGDPKAVIHALPRKSMNDIVGDAALLPPRGVGLASTFGHGGLLA